MPQTVFDVGDPITSRLKLGVIPDGTTQVTVTVTRPDGATIAAPQLSAWDGDERTVQFYATDTGLDDGGTLSSAGDWLVVWRITGTGANVLSKVYNVAPMPGTGTRPAWSPFLSQVADHVPYLTVDTLTPGSQLYLGTFTGATTPTDEVAQRHIDAAVATMFPAISAISPELYATARTVAALRAAASLARADPRRNDDVTTATQLDTRADAAWATLVDAAEAEGTVTGSVLTPVAFFPPPVHWGDLNL
jgi:hypothetical protein